MTELRYHSEYEVDYGTEYFYDIYHDGEHVGELSMIKYDDFNHCERIDVYDEYQNRGYGTAAIKQLNELYGRVVFVADNKDAARLYARLGDLWRHDDADYIDLGYGVYEI